MKKLKSFILTAGMLISVVSCSPAENKEMPAVTVQADELSETAYRKSAVEVPKEVKLIFMVFSYNAGENCFFTGTENRFYRADRDFSKITPVEIPDLGSSEICSANVTSDGKIVMLRTNVSCDEESDEATTADGLHICVYDENSKEITDNEAKGYTGTVDSGIVMQELISDDKNILVHLNGSYEFFSLEGEYIGEVTADDGEVISAVGRDKNGFAVITEKDDVISLRRIDGNSSKLTTAEFSCNIGESVVQISEGTGGYSLFLRTRSRIYGVNEKGEISALFNCSSAEIGGDEISGFSMDSEGNFILCENYYSDGCARITKYTQCDPSELENIPVLEIGISESMEQLVNKTVEPYNSMQSDIKVKLVKYKEPEPNQTAETLSQLEKDILSGDLPDIFITTNPNGRFCGIDLMKKDVFCDLAEFMANDDELRKDNIFPEVLNVLTMENGKIPLFATGWRLDIGYYGKSSVIDKYIDKIEKFDIDGYLEFLNSLPKDVGVTSYLDSDTVLHRFTAVSWMNWVDVENVTCSFDSDSFINFLKYAGGGEGDFQQQLGETQEYDAIKASRQYLDDTALLGCGEIAGFASYMNNIRGSFGGEKLTIIGNPTSEGSRTYIRLAGQVCAIADSSDMKEQAWEFLKYYVQNSSSSNPQFPLTISGFESEYENLKEGIDDDELGKGWYYWDGREKIEIGDITEADKNYIMELLNQAVPPKRYIDNNDDTPYNIYYEETDRFFAGECTAERCAEIIQSRMKVYLSEQFG